LSDSSASDLQVWVGLCGVYVLGLLGGTAGEGEEHVIERGLVDLDVIDGDPLVELTNNERHRAENDDIEQLFRRVLQSPAIPLAKRVRMVCSVSAIVGALVGAEGLLGDVPIDELAGLVREAMRDLLVSH
jgi:hypothetical protein